MTDSMKFGPEWLRNLSTDSSSSVALGNSNGSNTSAGSSSSTSSSGGNNHTTTVNSNNGTGTSTSSSASRNMFPEFRYGREEMLSLFDKNCKMPEILPLYRKIFIEKSQIPLALTPSTEDELSQNTQAAVVQRPLWLQRSPLGFSSSSRGIGRGAAAERGRMRGKPMYSTYQRSPSMFEEDVRSGLLKPERGTWYERNGSGDPGIGNSSSGGNVAGPVADWNGTGTPHTSPRREFSNHSRNMENWRRNRADDGAGEPTTEAWRNTSSTHSFGGLQRWGRSTSWRDEDGAQGEVQASNVSAHNSNQRSFANSSSPMASANSIQKGSSGKLLVKSNTSPITSLSQHKNSQWNCENGNKSRMPDGEDNLPEWATDIPLEGGGTFDSSGAFLGSSSEEVSDVMKGSDQSQKEDTEELALDISGRNADNLNHRKTQPKIDHTNCSESVNVPESNEIENKVSRSIDDTSGHLPAPLLSSSFTAEQVNAPPTKVEPLSNIQVPKTTESCQIRRLSDHMIEAADDMVKKLINDDDISEIQKPSNNSAYNSTNISTMKSVNSLEQSLLASQNVSHVTNTSNPVNVPHGHKGMFYFRALDPPQAQLQLQHQFQPPNMMHNNPPSMSPHSDSDLWFYRDPQSKVQGPFASLEMTEWYRAGYFNETLLVRRACDTTFRALGDLIKTCQNNMPFTHSSLLGTINMNAVPIHHKDQCEELKGNVTAAADTLSAAVKNMNSVDMLHMLNVHFQMLQEQYIRSQEMAILSELAKNEAFHRLSPAERESVVRQKAQINGLPEYLTSLTNLGNTLATLNPSAGTQLFNAILECSKKDSQHQVFPQPHALSPNYMDVGEFILSMQRQQQPNPPQQQNQQNDHQQQHLNCQIQPPFSGFEGNMGSERVLSSSMLEDLNIRMLMSGSNARQTHNIIQQNTAKISPSPQEIINSNRGNNYLSEQQMLAANSAAAAVVVANATQSPLLQMWLPSQASNIMAPSHGNQVNPVQISQQPQNQWTAGGPLVGISSVMTENCSEQSDSAQSSTPASMWMNVKSVQKNDSSNEVLRNEMEEPDLKPFSRERASVSELDYDGAITQTATIDDSSQLQTTEDNCQSSLGKLDFDEENSQIVDKLENLQGPCRKQKQLSLSSIAVNQKLKDDFKKVDSEEKRRQKEERKRQQLEEEKRRLQLVEQEQRRQVQEEEDRQKQIQAQRRKALLGSGAGNGNSSVVQKSHKVQSSVAPWSAQSSTTNSNSGPGLAEIQKAERRERRADQQRQMELLEKQVRLNSVAALENDTVPKWNAAPVQVKSIAEIQAEEAKKLNAEALIEAQRRKELELQAALNAANISSSAGNSTIASTWNNVAQNNKNWGSNAKLSNNSLAAGFWEEGAKIKTGTGGLPASSFAAAIATGKQQNNGVQKQQATSAAAVSSRNLKKSQTVSVMQRTAVPKNSKGASSSLQAQTNAGPLHSSKQAQNSKAVNLDKKTLNAKSTPGNSVVNSGSKDEFQNEFENWCMKSLSNMNTKVDVPTFVTFLRDLESPYEVKDYIRIYLGESKEFNDFAKQFLERRSKYKNLQRAQNAHNDDMCKPAPAITPSAGNENSDSKNKQKKLKKNKMTKLDARILGFSVTAAEGRINVGDRDYVDAP